MSEIKVKTITVGANPNGQVYNTGELESLVEEGWAIKAATGINEDGGSTFWVLYTLHR